jgi:hypothetical protein
MLTFDYRLCFRAAKPRLTLSLGEPGREEEEEAGAEDSGWLGRKRPGLALLPQLNLARSVEVDTTLPLDSQE